MMIWALDTMHLAKRDPSRQQRSCFAWCSESRVGRRVRKAVSAWDTGGSQWESTPMLDELYVYDGWTLDPPGNANAFGQGPAGFAHPASQGWNVVLVLNGNASNAVTRRYTWGLDLSGLPGQGSAGQGAAGFSPRGSSDGATAGAQSRDRQFWTSRSAVKGERAGPAPTSPERERAGRTPTSSERERAGLPSAHNAGGTLDPLESRQGQVGGILAVEAPQAVGDPLRHWYFYDANDNVGQLLRYTAHYEYDPYGQTLTVHDADSSGYAAANPLRFSTKWFDTTTGLGYWGYRYYSPDLGRWMSRDPIEEQGGGESIRVRSKQSSTWNRCTGAVFAKDTRRNHAFGLSDFYSPIGDPD